MQIFLCSRKTILMAAVAVILMAAIATAQNTEQGVTQDALEVNQQEPVPDEKGKMTSEATDSGKKTTSTPSDEIQGAKGDAHELEDISTHPKEEMVSFTVNLPRTSLDGAAAGDFFFGDMLSSFGSLFDNLFSLDDWDEEMDSSKYSASSSGVASVGSYGLAPTSPANSMVSTSGGSFSSFATANGDATSHSFSPVGHEEGDENVFSGDEEFLPFLTSAYLLPGLQGLLGSLIFPFSDSFTTSFETGGIDTDDVNGSGKTGNGAGFGVFSLLSSLMQASPESLVGPQILSQITDEHCLFEVDLKSLPETASIVVGVEGDAVFVEYSNTLSNVSNTKVADSEEPGSEEHAPGPANKTGKSDSTSEENAEERNATEAPTEATGGLEKESQNKVEKTSSAQNLRGTLGATANVYSYERFVIDPVCDYESADAKAARVEDDRLLIKFPLKKARNEQASESQDNADISRNEGNDAVDEEDRSSSKTEDMSVPHPDGAETEKTAEANKEKAEQENKEEDNTDSNEADQVLQNDDKPSAPKRMAKKVSALRSNQPHRRILPLVAAEEF